MSYSLFSEGQIEVDLGPKEANKSELLKTLENNKQMDVEIEGFVSFDGFYLNSDKTIIIPELRSEKFSIVATKETELLKERLLLNNCEKYKVYFVLTNIKPKTYSIIKIDGIETVDEYKARLESERLAKLEAERIAEEKRLEAERLAKIEAERIAEENRKKLEVGLPIYKNHLAKAKEYENQKRWCYALGSYYDALSVDFVPEEKQEAIDGYSTLVKAILAGNPGLGSYNEFLIHDEWKKLLIDAEKFGCSFNPFEVTVGNLEKGDLDYTTKTATYSAPVSYKVGNRYKYTIGIIENGYKKAYKDDWKDLPKEWPIYSVSYKGNDVYNVEGVCVFKVFKNHLSFYNAFAVNDLSHQWYEPGWKRWIEFKTLMDCKFNIVDENGKELVKPVRCLLGYEDKVTFKGITPEVMDLIEEGKAYINPINYYLQYGEYYEPQDFGGRALIKDFSEIKLPTDTTVFNNGNNIIDKTYDLVCSALSNISFISSSYIEKEIISGNIPTKIFEYFKEYDSFNGIEFIESVIGSKIDYIEYDACWFDAIIFCNKLSIALGLEPVYEIPLNIDRIFKIYEYNNDLTVYEQLQKEPIVIKSGANGYRLPHADELPNYSGWSDEYDYLEYDFKIVDKNNWRSIRTDTTYFRLVRNIQ